MGTRYNKSDKVSINVEQEGLTSKKELHIGEVVNIINPDSDSPDYVVNTREGTYRVKASEMKMVDNDSPSDPWVFADTDRDKIDITERELLGVHKYEDVLYTGETDVVNVRTGETPSRLDKSVKEAKQFAEETRDEDEPPRVAKKQGSERAVESGSPYTSTAFFHFSITGGMDWHTVFHRAYYSPAYDVDIETDYKSGDLTITVRESNNF